MVKRSEEAQVPVIQSQKNDLIPKTVMEHMHLPNVNC